MAICLPCARPHYVHNLLITRNNKHTGTCMTLYIESIIKERLGIHYLCSYVCILTGL